MATDYYQLRLQGLHQTEYNECVLFFKGTNLDAAEYYANAVDLVNTFDSEMKAQWLDMLPASYQLLRATAKKVSAGGGAEYTLQYDIGAEVGAVAGGAASQQLCPIMRLIPPMGIKSAGRLFLPCIAESQIQANQPNATWGTNFNALSTALIGPAASGTISWSLQVYSRKNNVFSDVLATDSSPIVGWQSRRRKAQL